MLDILALVERGEVRGIGPKTIGGNRDCRGGECGQGRMRTCQIG